MSQGCCQGCNDSPPCPTPVLECRSVGGEYCGILKPSPSTDPVVYTVVTLTAIDGHTETTTYARNETTGACVGTTVCAGTTSVTSFNSYYRGNDYPVNFRETTITTTTVYNSDCTTTVTCSGSDEWTAFDYSIPPNPELAKAYSGSCTINADCSIDCSGLYSDGAPVYDEISTVTYDPELLDETTTAYTIPATTVIFPTYGLWPGETTPTPAALKIGQSRGTVCGASRTDEGQTKSQYRIKHLPTGTCYLKVWISKIFTPTGGAADSPVITTYEWTGTGNPCLTVALDPVDADSQKINGAETEVGVPDTAGITTVSIIKYSCVNGYEPDISDAENPQPDGFPDPTWEATPP